MKKLLNILSIAVLLLTVHVQLLAQTITTFAGNGFPSNTGDGGAATNATITSPKGIAADATGNIYFTSGNCVRMVNLAGVISTFAGMGTPGFSGDGSLAIFAELNTPTGLATDGAGNVYIADYNNHRIRKVNSAGYISTIAGNGFGGFSGDGVQATATGLGYPANIAFDAAGNLYIADEGNMRIRKVAATGIIRTVAGTGTAGFSGDGLPATNAKLDHPYGLAVDGAGNIYIGDYNNYRVRKVNTFGTISTIAGNGISGYSGDGVPSISTTIGGITGIMLDALNNVYIADPNYNRVRKINTGGTISTYAGNGGSGYSGDGIPATSATIYSCRTLITDVNNNTYITDANNNRIRMIACPGGRPVVAPILGATTFCAGTTITLTNATSGGTWSSGSTGIATIGSTSGIATGVAAGLAPISYRVSNSCGSTYALATVTVITTPALGPITGTTDICRLSTSTLSNSVSGGTWTSSAPAIASIGSTTGIVTGVAAGTAIITYRATNTCGASYATTPVTVSLPLTVAPISGPSSVCQGTTITLTDPTPAGEWSSSAALIASVGTTGIVTGVSAGTAIISYSLSGACGAAIATKSATVLGALPTGSIITTLAGTGVFGFSGDGGPSTAAQIQAARYLSADKYGNIYIADFGNYAVRKITPAGMISTIAGIGGASGYTGDGGPATAALLTFPASVAADTSGNIYILDNGNCVRKVNAAGIISTFIPVGSGFTADDICTDRAGNLYVASRTDLRIKKYSPLGVMSIFAGTGFTGHTGDGGPAIAATIGGCIGITADKFGNVYITDMDNSIVRKINAAGIISHFAGAYVTISFGDGGPATNAGFVPRGIGTDSSGNVYIADGFNYYLRKVNAATNIITTVAGLGGGGYSGDGGPATAAGVGPFAVTVDKFQNIIISDHWNHRIRKVTPPTVGEITGGNSLCVGASLTLRDTTLIGPGTWSSSSIVIATVGSASGIVTGVSAGTATITYSISNGCGSLWAVKTITVIPLPSAGTISGASAVCTGATVSFSSPVIGGTWASSNLSIATVTGGGVVNGVAVGTATISYFVTSGCGAGYTTKSITVSPLPFAGTITGGGVSICPGGAVALSNATPGGTWSSPLPAIATVNSTTGLVTGVGTGSAVISYSVTNSCGTARATTIITIDPLPNAGTITGSATEVCIAAILSLTNTAPGGAWSSLYGFTSVTGTGDVTGLAIGLDSIIYTVTNVCGTATARYAVTVSDCPTGVINNNGIATGSLNVYPNPNNGTFTILATTDVATPVQIVVKDIVGRTVNKTEATTNTAQTMKLDVVEGIYFITVINGNISITKVVVVTKKL